MNLETRLTESLNDILRSSGYIFEIINKNKRQSNLITGGNNQLIPPLVTAQLGNSISKFDDILDDTISKFNDTKWCVEQMLESRQKQEEEKLRQEERKKEEEIRRKQEEERKRREEEEARKREEERKFKQAQELKAKEEQALLAKRKEEEAKQKQKQAETAAQQSKQAQQDNDLFNDFMTDDFDFSMNDVIETKPSSNGDSMTNPTDILSSIDYPALNENAGNNDFNDKGNKNELDLDINNILGNNDLILDGLNMDLLNQGDDINNTQDGAVDDNFDVDNFLNQFAGND